ncbi:lipopolysaccharide biosynthesis protein [Corynebacterium callunae]|uniref:Translocase involved in export of a cell surface polysaccaride n=1 Tax=Corynebacterium callunae DSM 20147 TaxID=1121353 RepID=M1UCY2_9CORY|nr:lipopolysaccharide biosynthesis protein [Corynebacterium callunae]AGG65770.1 translocase involved in export of a cell surface polysaccaride [Corynebacterium callunae DSM 20147]
MNDDGKSLRQSAAKGSAVTLLAQGLRIVLQLVSVVVLARLILPDQFGLYAMVLAVASVASIFLDFGFSMAALRSKFLTNQQQSNLFWINVGAGAILSILVFFLANPISNYFNESRLVGITQGISVIYLIGGITAQFRVKLNREMRFKALASIDVISPLIGLITAILLALTGFEVMSLVFQQIATELTMLLISFFLARWIPVFPRKTEGMKELLTFGAGFAATRVLSYLTQNVDSIAIGRVWGAAPLGLYDRAYRVSVGPITQISFPMTRIAIPVLNKVVDSPPRFISALKEAQLIGTFITSTLLLILAGVSEPVVVLLFGPPWVDAAPILSMLCIGATFRTVQQVSNWVFMVKGLAGDLLKFNLVAQPLIVFCTVAGVWWGPVGVAVGSSIGYGFYWLLSIWWAGRVTNMNLFPLFTYPLKVIIIFSLPAGIVAFVVASVVDANSPINLLSGVAAATCWLLIIYMLSKSIRTDIKKLINFTMIALGRHQK